jgi:L-malate glycosyltransferase
VLHVDSGRFWRGGQNQVRLTAHGMAKRGHTVAVACRRGAPLAARAREEALDVREVPFGGELSPFSAIAMARILEETQPDVVQAHDPHALTATLLAMAPRRRLPVVATRRVDFAPHSPLSRVKYQLCPRARARCGWRR